MTCKKQFSSAKNVRRHCLSHTNERSFVCEICEKRFNRCQTLHQHLRTHTGERSFVCEICNKKFIHKLNLHDHQKIHTNERPYECTICNKTFSQSSNLKRHKKRLGSEQLLQVWTTQQDEDIDEKHVVCQTLQQDIDHVYLCTQCHHLLFSDRSLWFIHFNKKTYYKYFSFADFYWIKTKSSI